jgi:hypothetical protein
MKVSLSEESISMGCRAVLETTRIYSSIYIEFDIPVENTKQPPDIDKLETQSEEIQSEKIQPEEIA